MADSDSSDFQRELSARLLALPMVQNEIEAGKALLEQERERIKRQAEQLILGMLPAPADPCGNSAHFVNPAHVRTVASQSAVSPAALLAAKRHSITSDEKKTIRAKARDLIQAGTMNHAKMTTAIMNEGRFRSSREVIKNIVKEECEDAGRTDLIQGHPDYRPPGKNHGF